MKSPRQLSVLLAALSLAAGCSDLLPKAEQQVASPWTSFEAARTAFEQIEPERTTVAELRARGIDPYTSENVQLLSYSDVLLKFPLADGWSTRSLDSGLRHCLEAGKKCTGYAINVQDVHRDRVGSFVLDLLNFKRTVDVKGWSFNGLILLVDGRAVYTLYGGQPKLQAKETSKQPLGPVQSLGDVTSLFK
jgi:hypothetical protein